MLESRHIFNLSGPENGYELPSLISEFVEFLLAYVIYPFFLVWAGGTYDEVLVFLHISFDMMLSDFESFVSGKG